MHHLPFLTRLQILLRTQQLGVWCSAHAMWCIVLVLLRPLFAQTAHGESYNFLLINLALAWIPVVFALQLKRSKRTLPQILFFCLWFLFFPNAGYVFTDLWHLVDIPSKAIWFDIIMLFSVATNAMVIGDVSLNLVHEFLLSKVRLNVSWAIVIGTLMLSAIGIYMGRFLRFNSWDFFLHPASVLPQTLDRFSSLVLHPIAVPFTLLVTGVLLWQYVLVRIAAKK